jgi:hypothetical protein
MTKCCIICSAVASPDLQLWYCDACQSASYCSKACQRKDWKKQHKKICKLINVGRGDMQIRNDMHTIQQIELKERMERGERGLDEDGKRFFNLFEASTLEGRQAAALEMRKIAKRQTKYKQMVWLFQGIRLLVHSDAEMLSWPNSPLLVMLEFVDANVLNRDEHEALEEDESRETPLHDLADLASPSDYSTQQKSLLNTAPTSTL